LADQFSSQDHHYVPKFYTKRWADETRRVLCYERVPSGRITFKPVVPKGTGFQPNLYATPAAVFWESHDPHIIEREFFSPIDNDAAARTSSCLARPETELVAPSWSRESFATRDHRAAATQALVPRNSVSRVSVRLSRSRSNGPLGRIRKALAGRL
jgi:hypothetical protein